MLIKQASGKDSRVKRYRALIGKDAFIEYDPDLWYSSAVDEQSSDPSQTSGQPVITGTWGNAYQSSDWYKFHAAVKGHRDFTLSVLKETFNAMEIRETIMESV